MSPSGRHIIAWLLRALLAAAFIISGFHKLSTLSGTIKMLGGLGLPGWLAYLIGRAERLGLIIIIIMLAALFMHANRISGGLAWRHYQQPQIKHLVSPELPGPTYPAWSRAAPAAEPSPRPRVANYY